MRNSWIFIVPLMIILAISYLVFYDNDSRNQIQNTLSTYQEQAIAQLGELYGNQNTITRFMKNEEMMNAMKVLFITHCSECHGIQGTGVTGPNLCDDSYTFVKKLPDIVESITKGNIKLGMTSFEDVLSQTEIVLLAAYVANLRGSSSVGKYAEGVIIEPCSQ